MGYTEKETLNWFANVEIENRMMTFSDVLAYVLFLEETQSVLKSQQKTPHLN